MNQTGLNVGWPSQAVLRRAKTDGLGSPSYGLRPGRLFLLGGNDAEAVPPRAELLVLAADEFFDLAAEAGDGESLGIFADEVRIEGLGFELLDRADDGFGRLRLEEAAGAAGEDGFSCAAAAVG